MYDEVHNLCGINFLKADRFQASIFCAFGRELYKEDCFTTLTLELEYQYRRHHNILKTKGVYGRPIPKKWEKTWK